MCVMTIRLMGAVQYESNTMASPYPARMDTKPLGVSEAVLYAQF